jgi:hypothetical protein
MNFGCHWRAQKRDVDSPLGSFPHRARGHDHEELRQALRAAGEMSAKSLRRAAAAGATF